MFKSDYSMPKRASTRPSITRDGAKLGRDSFALGRPMFFRPVPCQTLNGKTSYRLQLETDNDNIVNLSDMANIFFDEGCPLKMNVIESVLDAILEIVPKYIARTGRAVRIGNLALLKPYIRGQIENANDPADPVRNSLEIHASSCPALRHSLSRARLVNSLREGGGSGIDTVMPDSPTARQNTVDIDNWFIVAGKDVFVPDQSASAPSPDGNARIETRDGKLIGYCDVKKSVNGLFYAYLRMDTPPAGDKARLVVETFGEGEKAKEKKTRKAYTRNITLLGLPRRSASSTPKQRRKP